MPIATLDTALYRIELPVPLSDSTHGTMTHFELVTVRLRDSDGAEGVGYTYTTGAGGAAVHALIDQGLRPVLLGADADQIEALWTPDVVEAALRRAWRVGQPRGLGLRHRAVRPEGAAAWRAAVADARRVRSRGALLRRRHRPGVHRWMRCCGRPTTTSPRASARSR